MKLKIFTVFDSKVELYITPFTAITTAAAKRMFEAAAQTAEHEFHKFAGDYTLFELGEFNQADSTYELLPCPISLGNALEYQGHPEMIPVSDINYDRKESTSS